MTSITLESQGLVVDYGTNNSGTYVLDNVTVDTINIPNHIQQVNIVNCTIGKGIHHESTGIHWDPTSSGIYYDPEPGQAYVNPDNYNMRIVGLR